MQAEAQLEDVVELQAMVALEEPFRTMVQAALVFILQEAMAPLPVAVEAHQLPQVV